MHLAEQTKYIIGFYQQGESPSSVVNLLYEVTENSFQKNKRGNALKIMSEFSTEVE